MGLIVMVILQWKEVIALDFQLFSIIQREGDNIVSK